MNLGKALFEAGDEVQVVLEGQVRMQAAYDMKLRDGFAVAGGGGFKGLVQGHGISARSILLAAEGTQPASRDADIGWVDVPVDVEISHIAVHALADVIGQPANRQDISRAIEGYSIVKAQPFMGKHLIRDGQEPRVFGLKYVRLGPRSGHGSIAGSHVDKIIPHSIARCLLAV